MLHILLTILKIIGIAFAVIIGLILLIICVVVFAALRYEITASGDGDIKSLSANVKFRWLFRLISGRISYQGEKLDWQVKIAWKKLNVPKEENVPDSSEEELDLLLKEEFEQSENEEKLGNGKSEEKPVFTESNKSIESKQPKKRAKKKKVKKKKEPFAKKIKLFINNVSEKAKKVQEIKEKVLDFIQTESHKKAFQKLLKELFRLLKKIKPKKLKANVEYGFEDPYKTGSILAYLSMLYPFYGDNINIKPNFEQAIVKGDVYIKGRIRIAYMINMGIRSILDKNVRLTIKDIMKLVAKK